MVFDIIITKYHYLLEVSVSTVLPILLTFNIILFQYQNQIRHIFWGVSASLWIQCTCSNSKWAYLCLLKIRLYFELSLLKGKKPSKLRKVNRTTSIDKWCVRRLRKYLYTRSLYQIGTDLICCMQCHSSATRQVKRLAMNLKILQYLICH